MGQESKGRADRAGNPLATIEPWDLVADGYTAELLAWGEYFARQALAIASLPPSPSIVDVAAGPGALSLLAARQRASVSAVDFSPAMVANLHQRADGQGLEMAESWQKVQRSAAPVVLLRRKLGVERWGEVAEHILNQLCRALGVGSVEERTTLHLGVGVK